MADIQKVVLHWKIFRIVIFILAFIFLISLFDSTDNIRNYFYGSYQLTFWQMLDPGNIQVSNPIGIFGAFVSHLLVNVFGHLFSFFGLLYVLVHLFFRFAKIFLVLPKRIVLFILIWIGVINILYFMFDSAVLIDKYLFWYIYSFFSMLIGNIGVVFLCIIGLVMSFRLFFVFNPFIVIKNVVLYLKDVFVVAFHREQKPIEIDETVPTGKGGVEVDNIPPVKEDEEEKPQRPKPIEFEEPPLDYPINLLDDDPLPETTKTTKSKPENIAIDDTKYVKPDIEQFLYRPDKSKTQDKAKLEAEIKEKSIVIKDKLAEFGVEANVINVNVGPIITQYELEPAKGIKVNRFTSLSDDLALALKEKGIRVQAPIPGRGLIGVEVPNKNVDFIYLRDIFLANEMINNTAILSIALGKDIAGRPIVTDLAKTPHLLIAGATGSGKSVCINTIICSLLLRTTPEEVRLVMIDPKRIELSGYEGIPHLIQSVVTDPEDALNTLNWAVYEMEKRYEMLQESKVRDITSFNQKINDLLKTNEAEEIDRLPYIVLIVDEFADLIMTAGREIELPIARLAQMARAVGIHLILATQRPSIKVITGVIKANFPARIAFRVSSKIDSRVILDTTGAEKLLGNGDMLFLPPGKASAERIHGTYLSDSEIEGLVEYLKLQPKPKLTIEMTRPEVVNLDEFEYDDDLFPEATHVVVSANLASVSMLQRHFKIGYARAGRLIDLMEKNGVIGPHIGSKPRDVLMTKEDLEKMELKNN